MCDPVTLACVGAFGVDQTVKTSQIHSSFDIDLNGWHPAAVLNMAAAVLKLKALKLGN